MKAFGLGLIALTLVLTGCETEHHSTAGAEGPDGVFKQYKEHEVASYKYIVDPPDEISILAPGITELNNVKQTVSAQGTVTFNLIGEVPVAGKTPDEIASMLRDMTKKYYTNPDIKIVVTANSKFFYIFGLGGGQLKHPFTGRDTVIEALADATFNEGGWPEQIRVSRPGKNGKKDQTAVVDFTKVFDYGDMKQNYLLEQGDIVYIPQTPLTVFGTRLNRIVGPLSGASSGVGAGQSLVRPAPVTSR